METHALKAPGCQIGEGPTDPNWEVAVDWHFWQKSYDRYEGWQADNYQPRNGYAYQEDVSNEQSWSLLDEDQVDDLMRQLRSGAKIRFADLLHFDDTHQAAVEEILQCGYYQDVDGYMEGSFAVAFTHGFVGLDNPKLAKAITVHLLQHDHEIEDIADQWVDYAEDEDEFWRFVRSCKRTAAAKKLDSELKPNLERSRKQVKKA